MKNRKLYLTFYKSFCFTSIVITFACAYFIKLGGLSLYSVLFWFKVITLALIYYYMKEYKSKEFYFYKNLGVSKKALWIFAISIDMIIYFVVIFIALKIHEQHT